MKVTQIFINTCLSKIAKIHWPNNSTNKIFMEKNKESNRIHTSEILKMNRRHSISLYQIRQTQLETPKDEEMAA
ncbi:hypothetical protein DPMN_077726 [Dreissena polymorpha]|uniref:Uncharacterized protein n=1 Tax=Dreissena polymorpha TaxID=45954 RepID=A0A9D3YP61_DREPO|nr:hypothetical protein DPMN_077726 [Dreissena polymorpha]